MFIHRHRSAWFILWLSTWSLPSSLSADMVFLEDGRLLFGILQEDSPGQPVLVGFGEPLTLASPQIAKVETSVAALADLTLAVVLGDNSVLWGRLVEYDDELGLFLDISFGTLNIPFSAIQTVYWKERSRPSAPGQIAFGAGLSILQPFDTELFGLTYSPTVTQSTSLALFSGLSFGQSVEYQFLTYLPDTEVRYRVAVLMIHAAQDLVPLFTQQALRLAVSPFVRLGAGISFVSVVDESSTALNNYYGTINTVLRAALGAEYRIVEKLSVAADAQIQGIFQDGGLWWMAGGGLSLRYEL